MSDKETSGYSARSSQVSIAFEVRGCPRGRKATISSSATKRTSAKSGGNSKGLTSKAKSNFFVRNHVGYLHLYKALRDQMKLIYQELQRLAVDEEVSPDLLETLQMVALTLNGLKEECE